MVHAACNTGSGQLAVRSSAHALTSQCARHSGSRWAVLENVWFSASAFPVQKCPGCSVYPPAASARSTTAARKLPKLMARCLYWPAGGGGYKNTCLQLRNWPHAALCPSVEERILPQAPCVKVFKQCLGCYQLQPWASLWCPRAVARLVLHACLVLAWSVCARDGPRAAARIMTQPIISTSSTMARLAVLAATIALANAQIKICTSPPVWEGACVAANLSHPLPPSSVSQQVCTRTHEHMFAYVPQLAHMSAHTVTAPTALRMASPVLECAHQSGSVLATPVTSFLIWHLMLRHTCGRNAAPAHTEDDCHNHACIVTVHPLHAPRI
jgi:hypothetical protein